MHKGTCTALVCALVAAAAPARALADDYDDDGAAHVWKKPRFEAGLGALVGSQRVGTVAGSAGGMHVDAGLKLDRMYLYGEYDFLSIGQSAYDTMNPVRGFLNRFGVDARYSVATFGGHSDVPVRGDIWAEVGTGYQEVDWHDGGRLGRRDLSFGFGAQATFRIGREHPHFIGVYYAMKTFVARTPPGKDRPPSCAGPCDEPTGPSPWDFGVMFNFGIPFGR